MIVSSASPLSRMVAAKSRCSSVERRVEQQAAHADDGVHRRADLVAHGRQERALGLVGALGRGARFLRLLEQPRVLDRDHRLVGEGLEQRQLLVGERPAAAGAHVRSSRCRGLPTASAHSTRVVADSARCSRIAARHVGASLSASGTCTTARSRMTRSVTALRSGFGKVARDRVERRAALRAQLHHAVVADERRCRSASLANRLLAAVEDLVEHRLRVGHRAADDLQHFGRGRLLLQRLLGLVEQAHVLDRDHRLVGEGLQQRDLLAARTAAGSARSTLIAPMACVLAQHRHEQHAAKAARSRASAARTPGRRARSRVGTRTTSRRASRAAIVSAVAAETRLAAPRPRPDRRRRRRPAAAVVAIEQHDAGECRRTAARSCRTMVSNTGCTSVGER